MKAIKITYTQPDHLWVRVTPCYSLCKQRSHPAPYTPILFMLSDIGNKDKSLFCTQSVAMPLLAWLPRPPCSDCWGLTCRAAVWALHLFFSQLTQAKWDKHPSRPTYFPAGSPLPSAKWGKVGLISEIQILVGFGAVEGGAGPGSHAVPVLLT